MKPTFLFLLLTFTLALSEYPRMKYRGPAPFPKPPPYQQFAKKWQHPPPRPPVRSRPPNQPQFPNHPRPSIPVHMPNHHKIQMGVAASVNRPVAVPVRAFWKNTQTTFRTPMDYVTSAPVLPKKVFQSSPAILAQEYDFQVQSNNIPTPIKTIKQIGEKGPIHTIPAPNLSLADKPLVVEEVKPKLHQAPVSVEEVKVQRQPEVATYVQIQKAHQYQVTEAPEITKQTVFKNYYETQNLQPHELYQLINAYQQPATITVPVLQDPQLQQDYLQYPSVLTQQNYVDQIPQDHYAMDKSSYEEPVKEQKKDSSSLVTAAYNLEPEPSESISHSQYVQNYFDTRESNANNVEPDAKPSEKNNTLEGFYVSLPNKEAAETLASLQAAGKINSNLMQRGKQEPVSIYVPEDGDEGSRDETDQLEEEEEPAYDDYANEDLITEEMNQGGEAFGHRLKPK